MYTRMLLTAELLQAVSLLLGPLSSLSQQRLHMFRQQSMQLQFQWVDLNNLSTVNKVTLVSKLSLFIFRTWSISAEKKSQNCFIQAAAVTKTKRQQGLELWDQTTFVIMYNLLNYSYYYFIITHDITTYYDHTSKIDLTIIPSNLATKTWNQLTCSEM